MVADLLTWRLMAVRSKDVERVGPRTRIGGRDLKLHDLVVVECDDHVERLARVAGAYTLAGSWFIQLDDPPGIPPTRRWLPQSVKLRRVRAIYKKGR